MTAAELDELQPGQTIRHYDGVMGAYKGCSTDGPLWLLVDISGLTAVWPIDECEVAR